MSPNRVTWAALFAMMAVTPACGIDETCDTDQLPVDDPCYLHPCCDVVNVRPLPDGGFEEVPTGVDGGPDVQQRFCGACNG